MSLRSPLGQVRGLGSAKDGFEHWWLQRLTAVAMVVLVLWFVGSIISVVGSDFATMVNWAGHPFNSAMLILLTLVMFFHASLGLQVVIEDYVHQEEIKLAALLAMKLVMALLAVVTIVSVIRIAFFAVLNSDVGG